MVQFGFNISANVVDHNDLVKTQGPFIKAYKHIFDYSSYLHVFCNKRSDGLMKQVYVIAILWIFMTLACSTENASFVDPEFEEYVDQFFEEAQKRNLDISRDDYTFSVNFGEEVALGVCFLNSDRIEINRFYWGTLSDLTRQYLIFHELGHCILERLHDDAALPNGECKSIMRGGEGLRCRKNIENSNVWRAYYLDELFNTDTPLPSWYTTELDVVSTEVIFEVQDSLDESIAIDIGDFEQETNILFEAFYQDWDQSDHRVLSWSNQKIVCSHSNIIITDISDNLRYLKRDVKFSSDTKISFIRKDGFDYYLVDDEMIHIEEMQDNPIRYVRVANESADNSISKIPLSLNVSLIE